MHPFREIILFAMLSGWAETTSTYSQESADEKQLIILNQCLGDDIHAHMQRNAINKDNVCSWYGIECTNGLVTSLFVNTSEMVEGGLSWTFRPNWMPPTLRFAHIYKAFLPMNTESSTELWAPDRLPRDLKYLYMDQCVSYQINERQYAESGFSRLPSRMEELILIYSVPFLTIEIEKLPTTMRILYIVTDAADVDAIIVNYSTLLPVLKHLYVADMYSAGFTTAKNKVRTIGKVKYAPLKTTFKPWVLPKHSKFMAQFHADV